MMGIKIHSLPKKATFYLSTKAIKRLEVWWINNRKNGDKFSKSQIVDCLINEYLDQRVFNHLERQIKGEVK